MAPEMNQSAQKLKNEDFKNRVIVIRDMPEAPTVLDSIELRMLRCWDQQDYLEN